MAVGLALAAHAWLLTEAPRALRTSAAAARPAQVQVRQIVQPPAQAAQQAAAPDQPGLRAGPFQMASRAEAPSAPAMVLPAVADSAASAASAVTATTPAQPVLGAAERGDTVAAPAGSATTPLPTYTTQLPPAATLHFQLRRKAGVGQATLQWGPTDQGYRISLQGQVAGLPGVDWVSQGEIDEAGIAPLRYSESRRGREQRAANFQRGLQRITYSGPAVEHALVPGAQDRLSWLLQLGAVLSANPALAQEGAQVVMLVVGSRGDALAWTFEVQGMDTVQLPDGSVVQAVHVHRAPQRPYDTHADVWLDPARHHLPVRLHLQVRATGEGTDYLLQGLELR